MNSNLKSVHYIPAGLLLLLFLINVYFGLVKKEFSPNPEYLLFGIAYLVLCVFFVAKMKFSVILGFIVSIAIFLLYPEIVDFSRLNPWAAGFMSSINVTIIISCGILLLIKIKN